jgi:ABC-type sugar transport system permease subunit
VAKAASSWTTTYLAGDSLALLSLFNTVFYTVSASVLKFALGLWLAILLNENVPLKTFFRAIVLLPGSCRLPCRRWLSGG